MGGRSSRHSQSRQLGATGVGAEQTANTVVGSPTETARAPTASDAPIGGALTTYCRHHIREKLSENSIDFAPFTASASVAQPHSPHLGAYSTSLAVTADSHRRREAPPPAQQQPPPPPRTMNAEAIVPSRPPFPRCRRRPPHQPSLRSNRCRLPCLVKPYPAAASRHSPHRTTICDAITILIPPFHHHQRRRGRPLHAPLPLHA